MCERLRMVPLKIGNRTVATVFDLLGSAENDLTYALGWALSNADGFASALLSDVVGADAGDVLEVTLQRFEKPDRGFTDIELYATKSHVIIEAKKGWQVPGPAQLARYAARPPGDIEPRLLSVSAASREWVTHGGHLPNQVADVPVVHRSWGDLAQLAERTSRTGSNASKRLLRELAHYLKGAARMQNVSSNWAYCVSLSGGAVPGSTIDWMDVPLVHNIYFHPYGKKWPATAPNYMAFRWKGAVQRFAHVDSVKIVDDIAEALPGIVEPGAITGPHAVYSLGPPIKLPTPLKKGNIFGSARVWVMVDLLFTCADLKEATVASQERRRAAGENPEPEE